MITPDPAEAHARMAETARDLLTSYEEREPGTYDRTIEVLRWVATEAPPVAAMGEELRFVQLATPASRRATDMSGEHTLFIGCLRPDGHLRTIYPAETPDAPRIARLPAAAPEAATPSAVGGVDRMREAVVEDLGNLKLQLKCIADMPPNDQPHYPDGGRPFGTGDLRHFIDVLGKAIALTAGQTWLPVTDAAKDGKLVWLLVDYRGEGGDHPLEDAEFAATLGYNSLADTGEDEWKLVGWCWSHDHFVDGKGKVLAWKPIGFNLAPPLNPVAECPVSPLPSGKHQVDTSMESGPNNCFFCEQPMPNAALATGETSPEKGAQ